eukprot:67927_1
MSNITEPDQKTNDQNKLDFLLAKQLEEEQNTDINKQTNINDKVDLDYLLALSIEQQDDSDSDSDSKWREHTSFGTCSINYNLINIGDSIWYSTNCNKGQKGMVEYCIKTDSIVSKVKYPDKTYLLDHSICEYNGNMYIIDGRTRKANIMLFSPSTKTFQTMNVNMPKIGTGLLCVVMHGDIHMFGDSKHLIYSIANNTIQSLNDPTKSLTADSSNGCNGAVLKYENRIIRFGGNHSAYIAVDTFFMSSPIKPNQYDNISWEMKPQYKLKKPLYRFGYVIYKHYIITIGGSDYGKGGCVDTIYVLDLKSNVGWVEVKNVKYPVKNFLLAVLTGKSIHICEGSYSKGHFSISVTDILEDLYDGSQDNELKMNTNNKDIITCTIDDNKENNDLNNNNNKNMNDRQEDINMNNINNVIQNLN